jgi:hypothetical protein
MYFLAQVGLNPGCSRCGRLEYGFLRVRCGSCHAERLVTYMLHNGLEYATQRILQWQGKPLQPRVRIEASNGFYSPDSGPPPRTASFLSGGVDALSMLCTNRNDFALSHPASIRDCFFVHGMDVGGYE